jgi:hypothetical protein
MSKLDELLPDLTSMSDEQLTDLVRQIRRDRKINKRAPVAAKKKAAKDSAKTKSTIQKLLATLSKDQLKELLDAE